MDNYISWMGEAVKALGDGRVGGYLVRFSSAADPDLTGDYFDALTDFGEATRSPVYYQHGLDPVLKTRRIGKAELRVDDFGVWAEAQLEMRDEYERFIYGMAQKGKMGWSSGTAPHLVETEPAMGAMHIKHWPLGLDASLTPVPAEPRNGATPIKQLIGQPLSELIAELTPAQAADAQVMSAAADAPPIKHASAQSGMAPAPAVVRENKMDEQTESPRVDALEVQMQAVDAGIKQILAQLQDTPAAERAGYATNLGGTNDPEHKSFADWLQAVGRGDIKRLTKIYGTEKAVEERGRKDIAGDQGTTGGFLVPEQYMPLLKLGAAESQVMKRVRKVPVGTPSGHWPVITFATPTASSGQTALGGGITAATTEEGVALTETQPTFTDREWRVHKIGGYVESSNELIEDSPEAIEALLTGLIAIVVNSKNERNVIRGSGSGEPQGIYGAACTIALATAGNAVFAEADALALLSRHKNLSGEQSVWIINQTVIPDFAAFADSSYNPLVNFVDGVRGTLLGLPILYSEHVDTADANDVILADLGSYLWFQRRALEIAFSEHVGFLTDKGTWRFTERNDGFPWLNSTITLADSAGTTVSAFLYHDD